MEWWIWILLGLFLLLAELLTPGGFYIIFFGVSAVVVGVLAGFNAAGPLWFQVILFSVLSVIALWLFRERLLQLTQGEPRGSVDSFIGETAVVVEDIAINTIGKAELRGTSWNARNIGEQSSDARGTLQSGTRRRPDDLRARRAKLKWRQPWVDWSSSSFWQF